MATTVSDILTQAKSIAAAKLGASWHELPSATNLASNDVRRGAKGYGVRPLGAASAPTVTNAYALEHVFELVLMDKNPRKDDESQAVAVVCDLYDKQDEIFKQMVRAKLNLGATVVNVSGPSLSEPEFINGREFVALRQQFNVLYRQAI
jgi:hypothetical protein